MCWQNAKFRASTFDAVNVGVDPAVFVNGIRNAWRDWQAELNSRLRAAIAFLYGNFIRGSRRVVVDGIEPADVPGE